MLNVFLAFLLKTCGVFATYLHRKFRHVIREHPMPKTYGGNKPSSSKDTIVLRHTSLRRPHNTLKRLVRYILSVLSLRHVVVIVRRRFMTPFNGVQPPSPRPNHKKTTILTHRLSNPLPPPESVSGQQRRPYIHEHPPTPNHFELSPDADPSVLRPS